MILNNLEIGALINIHRLCSNLTRIAMLIRFVICDSSNGFSEQ
jgi:hypothetical protein